MNTHNRNRYTVKTHSFSFSAEGSEIACFFTKKDAKAFADHIRLEAYSKNCTVTVE